MYHVDTGVRKGQKRASDPEEVGLQGVVGGLIVLGIEPKPSERIVSFLNCRAIL